MIRRVAALVVIAVLAALCVWFFSGDDAGTPAVGPPPREIETSEPSRAARERPRRAAETAPADGDAAPDAAKPPERAFVVTVVSAADGRPVEGALVRLVRWGTNSCTAQGRTGSDGVARFDLVRGGWSRVVVRKVGFRVSRSFPRDPYVTEHRVELTPGIIVRGRVVFADSRAPAVGVHIRAWSRDEGRFDEADILLTTDEEGRFELAGVPPGEQVIVYAATPGYQTVDTTIARTEPGSDIELVLGDGGVLEGTVYGGDGRPAREAVVYLLPVDFDPPDPEWATDDETLSRFNHLRGLIFPATPTDEAGRYEFKGVPLPIDGAPQPRRVAARDAKGRIARSEPATFARHGARMQRDVQFTRAASIVVRVTSAAPLPKGTRINIRRNGTTSMGDAERELADGATTETFEGLNYGLYDVSVEASEEGSASGFEAMREVNLSDGERAQVAFAIGGDRRIEGKVVDASGKPVQQLVLKFETGDPREGSFEVRTTTRDDGTFVFTGLAPVAGDIELTHWVGPYRGFPPPVDGAASFAALRVRSVAPGGPALRLVLLDRGVMRGRFVPALPQGMDGLAGIVSENDLSSVDFTVAEEGRFWGKVPVVNEPFDLYFHQDGCAPVVFANRVVSPGATLDVGEVRFEPGLTFEGRLVDAGGKPLVRAALYATDPWMDRRLETDSDGTFELEHLPRVPLHVKVEETPGTATWRLTIDPAALHGEFTIGAGVKIAGRVLRADGEPARKTRLQLLPAAAGRAEHAGAVYPTTDDDGRFTVRVQPGKFRVAVSGGYGAPAVEPSSFEAPADGPNPPLELRLR